MFGTLKPHTQIVCLLLVRWQASIRAMGIHNATSQYPEVKLLDWVSYGFQFQTSAYSLSHRELSVVILWVTWSVCYILYSDGMFATGNEQWDTFTININSITISSTMLTVCKSIVGIRNFTVCIRTLLIISNVLKNKTVIVFIKLTCVILTFQLTLPISGLK